MRNLPKLLLVTALAVAAVAPVVGQVHKYFTPGTAGPATT